MLDTYILLRKFALGAVLDYAVRSDLEWGKGDPEPLSAASVEKDNVIRSIGWDKIGASRTAIDGH
jgi:hypothetical protein